MVQFMDQRLLEALGPPSFGDVTSDLRGPDDHALCVPDRRDRQRYLNQTAILAAANGLEMIDPLAAAQAFENPWFLVLAVLGNQDGDRLSDHLLGPVAKESF